jgi:hypothetical protein
VLGNDLALLGAYLDRLPRLTRPRLAVYADGELALECPLALDGRPRGEEACDYLERRQRYFASGRTFDLEGLRVHVRNGVPRERWGEYAKSLARARRAILAWCVIRAAPDIDLFVYEHLEDMQECLAAESSYVCNRLHPRVHVLLAENLPDDGGAGMARALARAALGPEAAPWVGESLAVAAADRYCGRPLGDWIAFLAEGRLLPSWDELTESAAEGAYSVHVVLPARALLLQQYALEAGKGQVRALWKGARLDKRRADTLYRKGVQLAQRSQGPRRAELPEDAPNSSPFLRGLALVESADVPCSSSLIDEALAEARRLGGGPNAASLTVFATLTDPDPPFASSERRVAFGSASDLALASAAAAIHRDGLRVLLSLEVLAQPNGAWADVWAWASPEDRSQFWKRYERVALHYALLAELCGIELYSLGSNLRESTRSALGAAGVDEAGALDPEQAEQRCTSWKELIANVHRGYGGTLTYGARFPAEAGDICFFDQLDCLGLLLYPRVPLGDGHPDGEQIRRALRYELRQALDLAVRWNKPLLLVQLGFPSRAESWATPMVPRGALDPEAQERFFEALVDVLAERGPNYESLRGFFLWNWPLDPACAGPEEAGFSLRRKPVESALTRLFTR